MSDMHPRLNNLWAMKICIVATVTTGGWDSGHMPNHLSFYTTSKPLYHIARDSYNEL